MRGPIVIERRIDPRGLCSICAEPIAEFNLHDDHAVSIGARRADEGRALVRVEDSRAARLSSKAPAGGEELGAEPRAARIHAHYSISKGATRNVSPSRQQRLPDRATV